MKLLIFVCETCGKDFEGIPWKHPKFCSRLCTLNRASILLPNVKRFWSRVQKGAPDECWPWTAGCEGQGYGCFPLDGKNWKAHRYAWTLKHGPIPAGKCILHSCDNPPCVNDAHLFCGTKKDNFDDMVTKGRRIVAKGESWQRAHVGKTTAGELNRHAKLKTTDIHIIRDKAASGATLVRIAQDYDVHPNTIGSIVSRKNWKHVP